MDKRRIRGTLAVVFILALAALLGGLWLVRRAAGDHPHAAEPARQIYYCPMHPSYRSDQPGNCPICSMQLVPLTASAPDPAKPGAETAAAPAGPPTIRISPERQQQIGVKFATAERRPATVETRAVGKVVYDETRIAHVHTKVGGWIEEVFVNFVGAPVREGQPLFTIYSPDLVASQQEYLLALRGQEELGQSSFERVAAGSRSLVDAARQRLRLWDLTADQIDALAERGEVARTVTIASPVNGIVTERAAYHHGRTVTPEMDLYTIVDLSRVWVQAQVYEYELRDVRVGQAAEVVLPYDPEHEPLRGEVTFVSPFVDATTRTGQVRLEFPNPDLGLKPETFVNVLLRRDLGERLIVPQEAVMDTGAHQYVFVDKGEGHLEPREIKAGAEVAAGRVVVQGLEEGERVVTAANFIIDSESRLKGAFDALTPAGPSEAPVEGGEAVLRAEVVTDPSPPRVGNNRVRVRVFDAEGRPIGGAEADIRLFMPAMPGMAAVDLRAPLRPAGEGEYVGEIDLPVAWSFAATITLRRSGRVIGTAETTLTVR